MESLTVEGTHIKKTLWRNKGKLMILHRSVMICLLAVGCLMLSLAVSLVWSEEMEGASLSVEEIMLLAEQGDVNAQFNLGLMYYRGNGVLQDYKLAHKWFNIASAQGDAEARRALSLITVMMTREEVASAQELAREWQNKRSSQ